MAKPATLVASALVVGMVAGCTATDPDGTTPAPPASGSASVTPGGQPPAASFTVMTSLDVTTAAAAAEGRAYRTVARVKGRMPNGDVAAFLALTPDGSAVIAAAPRPKVDGDQVRIKRGKVLLQSQSREPYEISRTGPARQVFDAAVDDDAGVIVWAETSSTHVGLSDWKVFAHNMGEKPPLLGDSAAVLGKKSAPAGPDPKLTVSGNTAYWAASTKGKGGTLRSRIVARACDGAGKVRTVAERATLPAAEGDALYYVRSADVAPDFPTNRYEIHRVDSDGADVVTASGPLAPGQFVSALAADGDTVSWVVATHAETEDDGEEVAPQPGGELYALDVLKGEAVRVRLTDDGADTRLEFSNRRIVWGNGTGTGDAGMYVLDLRRDPLLWRVGEAEGMSYAFVADKYVAWPLPGKDEADPATNVLQIVRWS